MTCRFGYPGFAVLEPLQDLGWGELFAAMISRIPSSFAIHPGFSLCVVLTTPPFPYSRHQVAAPVGMPVVVGDVPDDQLHPGEVGSVELQLVTSGVYGWTAVVTGTGATIGEAKAVAYRNAGEVQAPNLRYRMDIGDELNSGGLQKLVQWGWLPGSGMLKRGRSMSPRPLLLCRGLGRLSASSVVLRYGRRTGEECHEPSRDRCWRCWCRPTRTRRYR